MWVLIAFLVTHNAGGPLMVDFHTEAACIAAKAAIEAKHQHDKDYSWVVCTPKLIKGEE